METLSNDISSLEEQISSLKSLIPQLHSTLLSLPSVSTTITEASDNTPSIAKARKVLSAQLTHNTSTTYRLVSGITAFQIQDPDPNAVDNGKVLGLRIELPQGARFGTPYFVFLVSLKASGDGDDLDAKKLVKIHRHTVPVAVPIDFLARKYLALPNREGKVAKRQDLHAFARALRNAVVGYHMRITAVEKLRVDAGIQTTEEVQMDTTIGANSLRKSRGKGGIISIMSSDAEHVVEIGFRRGTVARLRMDNAGVIERVAVRSLDQESGERNEEKLRKLRQQIEGGDGRIEGVVKRILAGEEG